MKDYSTERIEKMLQHCKNRAVLSKNYLILVCDKQCA
jgi:hypothetical protein